MSDHPAAFPPKCMACNAPMTYGGAEPEPDCVWCQERWRGDHQHLICMCRVPYTRRAFNCRYAPASETTRRLYVVGLHQGAWNPTKPIVKWR
jgi:hypothetical protein